MQSKALTPNAHSGLLTPQVYSSSWKGETKHSYKDKIRNTRDLYPQFPHVFTHSWQGVSSCPWWPPLALPTYWNVASPGTLVTEMPEFDSQVHNLLTLQLWQINITAYLFLEKEMATYSIALAWRIPGTVEPGGLPSVGSHRVGRDWSDLAAATAAYLFIYKMRLIVTICGIPSGD